ncbi:MAG: hypothetical protein OXM56_10320 [Gammaproteobacteria bacterium]|nr:hypothetical protein [Gammaproteobacteria bacterium]
MSKSPTPVAVPNIPGDLPGADLVAAGVAALHRGAVTVEALLVTIGAPRLRDAGLQFPDPPPLERAPEMALYDALCRASDVDDPYGRYNSLLRRLVSFERALEQRNARTREPAAG